MSKLLLDYADGVEWKQKNHLIVLVPNELFDLALPVPETVKGNNTCLQLDSSDGVHTPVASQAFTLIKGLWR